MKLCPICELNLIEDEKDSCSVCEKAKTSPQNGGSSRGGKTLSAYFQEEFTFKNQKGFYRGKLGFQAYNSKGYNVGIVFMCDDPRTPAFEHCELCIYAKYHTQYGEWHRIQSNGGRIKWTKLCEILKQNSKCTVFID